MRRSGHEHIPAGGPVLIACNHVAFIDPLLVALAVPARRGSWRRRSCSARGVLAPWLRRSGGFPVRRASPDVWAVRHRAATCSPGASASWYSRRAVSREAANAPGLLGGRLPRAAAGRRGGAGRDLEHAAPARAGRVRFGPPIPMEDLRASPRPGRNRRATERIMETLAAMVPSVGGPEQPAPIGRPWIPAPRGNGSIRS